MGITSPRWCLEMTSTAAPPAYLTRGLWAAGSVWAKQHLPTHPLYQFTRLCIDHIWCYSNANKLFSTCLKCWKILSWMFASVCVLSAIRKCSCTAAVLVISLEIWNSFQLFRVETVWMQCWSDLNASFTLNPVTGRKKHPILMPVCGVV